MNPRVQSCFHSHKNYGRDILVVLVLVLYLVLVLGTGNSPLNRKSETPLVLFGFIRQQKLYTLFFI